MDGRPVVIKENDIFLVSDSHGNVSSQAADGQGLYYRDTRFLSLYQLAIDEFPLVLLSAAGELSFMTTLQLANGPGRLASGQELAARSISVRRNRFLYDGLHERIGFFNYNAFPVRLTLRLTFGSDFRDMFDVRGYARRQAHGTIEPPRLGEAELWLPYRGLDGVERQTYIRFDVRPTYLEVTNAEPQVADTAVQLMGISGHGDPRTELAILPPLACAVFVLELQPKQACSITVHIRPLVGQPAAVPARTPSLDEAYRAIRASYHAWNEACTQITTDHQLFNQLVKRSQEDLRLLMLQLPTGLLPTAGIPWFSVPFGRDSLITAYETLILEPAIAYGTLRFLAQHQGRERNDWRDEEPGKILHEVRMGELTARDEVPFGPYYGSVDATPLFLVVLSELVRWTGDWEFATSLRPHVEAALAWIDQYGDLDGDGYVEYQSRSARGISNQGWKDSHDAILHRDGRPATPPIALCEVQGYVYDAKCRAAELFEYWGEPQRAARLRAEAEALRAQFERDFWLEEEGYYALALDAAKRPVAAVGSNAGQALWSGIVAPERAARVVQRLLSPELCCGWGIRTLSSREPTFNPMSYHNGSVWPHDNALIVAGLRRYGYVREALEVAAQVIEAGLRFPNYRLPELYCGFTRDRHYHSLPADYPVSCRPQAWAAGSVFLLLREILGLRPDSATRRLVLEPHLLPGIRSVHLRRLRVLQGVVDLTVRAEGDHVAVEVERGELPVVTAAAGARCA
ncbi:MAG TPA: glycogen debranching N-terminal domain-containing protein [Chloroflexota bacterium]|nr:glycogen debranching N-terminal domain-containing protein [Chloroflexota bacterium]